MTRRDVFALLAGLPIVGRLWGANQPQHSVFSRFPPRHAALTNAVWFEDKYGRRRYADPQDGSAWPEGYDYRVTRCPGQLHTEHYVKTQDGGSQLLMAGSSTFREDLVLALVQQRGYRLTDALVLSSQACERCMHSMAYALGLSWGYPEGSGQWRKAGTTCEWCREDA